MRVNKILISLFVLTIYVILSGCIALPLYISPTPQSTYDKNQISLSYYPTPILYSINNITNKNSLNIDLGFQNKDMGISIYYVKENIYNDTNSTLIFGNANTNITIENTTNNSLGILLMKNFWLKRGDYEYPWGNFYVSVQPSLVNIFGTILTTNNTTTTNLEGSKYYFPIDLSIGFRPGVYRESYNINLIARGGIGFSIPFGLYISGGVGTQGNFFVGNFGVGMNLEFIVGIGAINLLKGELLIGTAPLLNLYLMYTF